MGNKATVTSSTAPNPEAMKYYTDALAAGKAAASQPYQAWGTTASDYVAQINPQQTAGITGINQAAGSYQPYLSSATDATKGAMGGLSSADIERYMSPYLSSVAGTTADLMNQASQQAQSSALGSAASSGAFGGDRAGIAAANLHQQQQMALGNTLANIMNQGYGQALSTAQQQQGVQMQGAQQLAGFGQLAQGLGLAGANAQIGAGTLQQQTQQAGIDALMNNFMQAKAFPYQNAQYLTGLASALGPLMGATAKEAHPTNWLGNVKLATGGRVERASGGLAGGQFSRGYVPEVALTPAQPDTPRVSTIAGKSALGEAVGFAGKFVGRAGGGRTGYDIGGGAAGGQPEDEARLAAAKAAAEAALKRKEPVVAGSRGPAFEGLGRSNPGSLMDQANTAAALNSMIAPKEPVVAVSRGPAFEGLGRSNPGLAVPRGPAFEDFGRSNPGLGLKPPVEVQDIPQPSVVEPSKTQFSPNLVDTGKVPTGLVAPVIPLDTQIKFMLQEPEYQRYLSHDYASPASAATGMDEYYEISGGKMRTEAAAYAEDVYRAAQSGDMSGLPQNAQTIYNSLIQSGVDPVKAAGTVGRLMVESYPRIDPNARNTLGGGNGTFGIAQWRGPRMEELSEFSGVPLDALTGAPVSTPEGRYYSTGSPAGGEAGGVRASSSGGLGAANISDQPRQSFLDGLGAATAPGTRRGDVLLSILGGLGAVAGSRGNILDSLLSGVGGYANARSALARQSSDIASTNVSTLQSIANQTMDLQMRGYDVTMQDVARSVGYAGAIPYATPQEALSATSGASTAPTVANMRGTTDRFGNGVTVSNMDDPQFLQNLINTNGLSNTPAAVNLVAQARTRLAEITANGITYGVDQNGNRVPVQVPEIIEAKNNAASMEAKIELGQQILGDLGGRQDNLRMQDASLDRLANAFKVVSQSGTSFGPNAPGFKYVRDTFSQLGLPFDEKTVDASAAMDVISKEIAKSITDNNGQVTDSYRSYLEAQQPNITMQKAAVAELLAVKKAMIEREKNSIAGIKAVGANPSLVYDANVAGSSQPVDWEKYLPQFQSDLGVGDNTQADPERAKLEAEATERGHKKDPETGLWR